jgi:hypothetical protein
MTIGNVQISGIVYPIKLLFVRHQSVGISASGTVKVSTLFEDLFIVLKIEKTEASTAQNLCNYIRNTANFKSTVFTITPDTNIDLGNGLGISINVRYWSDNIIYSADSGNLFSFELIFRKEIT